MYGHYGATGIVKDFLADLGELTITSQKLCVCVLTRVEQNHNHSLQLQGGKSINFGAQELLKR